MNARQKTISTLLITLLLATTLQAADKISVSNQSATISLKIPGNPAKEYPLQANPASNKYGGYEMVSSAAPIPATIYQQLEDNGEAKRINISLTAHEDIYFNYAQTLQSGFKHDDCQFYLPGFWYRRNLRSPEKAPSFHTSDSWIVREDRLSSPLCGIFNEKTGEYITVTRLDAFDTDALTTHSRGEIIVSGRTSIGYTGFENVGGNAVLSFGFPYHEAPKTYVRKLTLAPEAKAFQYLPKGETINLTWEVNTTKGEDFSDFVKQVWNYTYDLYQPQPVTETYSAETMKEVMSNYFTESYVDQYPLKYTSGVHIHIDSCHNTGIAEVGFVGRVLLNAFNALEYGEEQQRTDLIEKSYAIFDSYLEHGFTPTGFFREVVRYHLGNEEKRLSIRRQSEGLYAMLYFLQYEKKRGRKHPQWENRVKSMLDTFLTLQKEDGSFPRKFTEDLTVVDNSGGSTPSATSALMLGYKYFNDKRYLASAKRTGEYLERELISKADYFSSTLDANCEDKEASYYASTAMYYLAMFSKGAEREKYAELAKKSAFFALSWYYMWDVPFAKGQMLGDVGLKTRGWGNVSVENNHIDVFIFDFTSVLKWLAKDYNEPRFAEFAEVIKTSMCQLLPYEDHLCGIAKTGYYPEVVQHTNWDYGKNGKGYYNDIFAPGWTVASLWELLTPNRIDLYLK